MSDELGLETFEKPRQPLFLNGPVAGERGYSEETARTIDQEIRKLLAGTHIRVRETLTAKRSILEALAKLLIEEEVVDRDPSRHCWPRRERRQSRVPRRTRSWRARRYAR